MKLLKHTIYSLFFLFAVDASAQDLLFDKIYAVHATRSLPDKDYLRAGLNLDNCSDEEKEIYSNIRQTVHFSLGELVRPVDGFMDWEDCPYAVVTQLNNLLPQLLNINCYDTFILGDLRLDPETYLFIPSEMADGVESHATIIPYHPPLREAIDAFIASKGAWHIEMNEEDIEDTLHEAYLDGININTLDFFSGIKQTHPWVSVGLRFDPFDGEHYRLSQIEQNLIMYKMQKDSSYLEEAHDHFENWSQSLEGFNWNNESEKAYRYLAEKINILQMTGL